MIKKLFIAVAVLVIGGGVIWYFNIFNNEEKKLFTLIKDQPEMVKLWNEALSAEEKIKAEPANAALYFDAGLAWKSIAEQLAGEEEDRLVFFNKSLEVYERGLERFGAKNILFYLNGGNLAQRVGDWAKAESYYKKAIEIAPADENGYLSLVDLYYYKLKKIKEEILPLFDKGIKVMADPTPLISGRATYLRRIREYEAALDDYRVMSEKYPNNTGYKEIIAELEGKAGEDS